MECRTDRIAKETIAGDKMMRLDDIGYAHSRLRLNSVRMKDYNKILFLRIVAL